MNLDAPIAALGVKAVNGVPIASAGVFAGELLDVALGFDQTGDERTGLFDRERSTHRVPEHRNYARAVLGVDEAKAIGSDRIDVHRTRLVVGCGHAHERRRRRSTGCGRWDRWLRSRDATASDGNEHDRLNNALESTHVTPRRTCVLRATLFPL